MLWLLGFMNVQKDPYCQQLFLSNYLFKYNFLLLLWVWVSLMVWFPISVLIWIITDRYKNKWSSIILDDGYEINGALITPLSRTKAMDIKTVNKTMNNHQVNRNVTIGIKTIIIGAHWLQIGRWYIPTSINRERYPILLLESILIRLTTQLKYLI